MRTGNIGRNYNLTLRLVDISTGEIVTVTYLVENKKEELELIKHYELKGFYIYKLERSR